MSCNKVTFTSKAEAREEARKIKVLRTRMSERGFARPNKRMRPYQCQHCGGWHLTSQKANVKQYRKYSRKIRQEQRECETVTE